MDQPVRDDEIRIGVSLSLNPEGNVIACPCLRGTKVVIETDKLYLARLEKVNGLVSRLRAVSVAPVGGGGPEVVKVEAHRSNLAYWSPLVKS